ncbi:MAG: hypothetical protein LBP98_00450 [Tannerella sp.]|jgi:hypothetical protein|nr:hypothetical protein [Tannerella sp.]
MKILIQKIKQAYFFYLFLFTLIFGVILYDVTGFKSMDGVAGILLLVLYILVTWVERKRMAPAIPVILCISLFYLCYSFYLGYNSRSAAVMDFLVQTRPYLTFFMVMQLSPSFSASQKKLLKRICLYIWPFFIPLGIYGLVNPSFFKTVMEQESNYVSGIVCLSLVYLYCSNFTVKELFTFAFMLTTGMIAIHAGFYGFYFLAVGILIYFQNLHVLKSGRQTGFALLIVFALTVYISVSQMAGYLFPPDAGNGDSDFTARSVLYRSAVDVLKDFFPFGSGFASFATELSGTYYSQIYAAYGLNSLEGFSPRNWFSVSGAYYPSLVQFGAVGILLYLFFWLHSAGKALVRFKREGDIQWFVIALIVTCFIFIENLSDAFFSSNKGFFMMMFLGLLAGKYGTDTGKAVVNTGEGSIAVEEYPFAKEAVTPPDAPDIREIPEFPPAEEIKPVSVVNEPEDEADDDEDDNENEYEYDDDGEDGNEETDTSCSDEAIEAIALEAPGMQQVETAALPEVVERSGEKDNKLIEREEKDMVQSEPEEKVQENPLNDEALNDDFLIFEPLLDKADVESANETTEDKEVQKHSAPEKQNEDNIREKQAVEDEETSEDDPPPIDYII